MMAHERIIQKVGVLGAGTMGAGIAQTFASAGMAVVLRDMDQAFVDRGVASIESNLGRLVAKGKLDPSDKDAIVARIGGTTDQSAFNDCDLIVEAVVENMHIKQSIFAELDKSCRADAILASNTSSLSITEIASGTQNPDRVIGLHFFNPAPVMQLVEVIRGIATAQETVDVVMSVAKAIGKQPGKSQRRRALW